MQVKIPSILIKWICQQRHDYAILCKNDRDTIEITIYTPPVKDDLDLYKNDIAT